MTNRVFDLQRQLPARATATRPRSKRGSGTRLTALRNTLLVALLVVPVAGAAEAPRGWIVASATAVALLLAGLVLGQHVRWAWLALVTAGAGFAMPRGELSLIGPGLFVATLL